MTRILLCATSVLLFLFLGTDGTLGAGRCGYEDGEYITTQHYLITATFDENCKINGWLFYIR